MPSLLEGKEIRANWNQREVGPCSHKLKGVMSHTPLLINVLQDITLTT